MDILSAASSYFSIIQSSVPVSADKKPSLVSVAAEDKFQDELEINLSSNFHACPAPSVAF